MKKLLSFGNTLSKEYQKEINGGLEFNVPYGLCLSSGCFVRCNQTCAAGDAPLCNN